MMKKTTAIMKIKRTRRRSADSQEMRCAVQKMVKQNKEIAEELSHIKKFLTAHNIQITTLPTPQKAAIEEIQEEVAAGPAKTPPQRKKKQLQ